MQEVSPCALGVLRRRPDGFLLETIRTSGEGWWMTLTRPSVVAAVLWAATPPNPPQDWIPDLQATITSRELHP